MNKKRTKKIKSKITKARALKKSRSGNLSGLSDKETTQKIKFREEYLPDITCMIKFLFWYCVIFHAVVMLIVMFGIGIFSEINGKNDIKNIVNVLIYITGVWGVVTVYFLSNVIKSIFGENKTTESKGVGFSVLNNGS